MEPLSADRKIIGLHVKSLSNMIRRYLDASLVACGMDSATGTQGMIVHFLYDHRGQQVYQRDVEAHFHIRRATATRTLQLMETNGLICREPDPGDARLKRILLTEKAVAGHEAFYRCLDRSETLLRKGISAKELDAFFATLNKMRQNLEEET